MSLITAYLLLPLLLFPAISTLPSFPLSPLRGVQRRKLQPDLIKPTFCPTPCEKVFGAESVSSPSSSPSDDSDPSLACLCACPEDRPIYLNNLGFCVEQPPEDCRSAVIFDDYPLDDVPVLTITDGGGEGAEKIVNTTMSWSDDFTLTGNFTPSCHISSLSLDSAIHRWETVSSDGHFVLLKTEDGQPRVIFNGSDEDVTALAGSIIQLKVACRSLEARPAHLEEIQLRPALMCITFRLEGESASIPLDLFPSDSRIQVVVLASIATILLLALIASGLAYFICWRIQKRRLIGSIALQYRTHIKHANQLANGVMSPLPHHHPHPSGHQRQSSITSPPVGNGQIVAQKRRLYFSADFFEPDCLLNPPPMAEQFLHDIRRMIDMARERIAARRYHPRMHPVYEEEDEEEEEVPPKKRVLDVCVTPPTHHSPPSAAEESPRSAKSADSGRETLSSTSSSSSDDSASRSEEEESEEEKRKSGWNEAVRPKQQRRSSAIPVAPGRSFRAPKISAAAAAPPTAAAALKATPPPIPPKPAASMIPRLGQASPKLQTRSLSTPTRLSESDNNIDEPSRHSVPPPSHIPGPSQRRHERRKGYAVFPVDPMLNKSLPRRPRRTAANEN